MAFPIIYNSLSENGLIHGIGGDWTNDISNSNYDKAHPIFGESIYVPNSGWTSGQAIATDDKIVYTDNGAASCWIKADGWTSSGSATSDNLEHYIFMNEYETVHVYANPDGALHYNTYNESAERVNKYTSAFDFTEWTHIAVTWSATDNRVRLWINGVMVLEDTGWTNGYHITGCTHYVQVGARSNKNTSGFKGWFKDYKMYNYEKTDFSDRLMPFGMPLVGIG